MLAVLAKVAFQTEEEREFKVPGLSDYKIKYNRL